MCYLYLFSPVQKTALEYSSVFLILTRPSLTSRCHQYCGSSLGRGTTRCHWTLPDVLPQPGTKSFGVILQGCSQVLSPTRLQKRLKGHHFPSDAEVIAAAETWLDGQTSDFFFEWLATVKSLVAVACFLPGRAKDLSAHRVFLHSSKLYSNLKKCYIRKVKKKKMY